MRIGIAIAVVLLTATSTAALAGPTAKDILAGFPPPENAEEIHRYALAKDTSEQLSFVVRVPYPSDAVVDHYDKLFAADGWRRCTSHEDSWGAHGDLTVDPPVRVHRIARFWINRSLGAFALAFFEYRTPAPDEIRPPDNDKQMVTIVLTNGMDDPGEAGGYYGVSCPTPEGVAVTE